MFWLKMTCVTLGSGATLIECRRISGQTSTSPGRMAVDAMCLTGAVDWNHVAAVNGAAWWSIAAGRPAALRISTCR